ncbi:MAG: hypothetical protein KDC92_16215, partial [Bacteroidetes bacterium]|nr:hypothetical protein [Bacteroidota bacterium]
MIFWNGSLANFELIISNATKWPCINLNLNRINPFMRLIDHIIPTFASPRYLSIQMAKSILFVLLILTTVLAKAQNLDFNWVNAIGEGIGQDDEARVVLSLPGGKVLVGGVFDEAVDFDPSTGEHVLSTRNGNNDIYFAKYDTTGKLFWVRQLQCTDDCALTDIAIDASNNIIVTGYFKGTIDFDPGLNPNYYTALAGSQAGFIAKFNESGILQWAHAIDGPGNDRTNGVATTASNEIIITGAMADSLDADLSAGRKMIHSKGNDDAFLIKYDSTGVHKWSFTIGFGSFDEGKDVEINTKGDICLVGEFRGTPDFDPSSNTYSMKTAGNADIFLASYTNQGNFIWAKRFGGTDEEWVNKLNISAKGKWLLAGSFKGTTNFETGTGNKNVTSAGNWDLYIAQFSSNGNFEWVTATGNTFEDRTFELASDANGNVYATGFFRNAVDFDMSSNTLQLSSTRDEIFVAAYDSSGNILWANQLGGIRFDQGYAIATTNYNSLLCAGIFREKADFDPGIGKVEFTTPSSANMSTYIAHYHAKDGAYRNAWALEDRNGGSDRIDDLKHDKNGDLVATGLFTGTVDFDPSSQVKSITSKGSFDAFLAKYDTLGNCKWAIGIGGNNQDFGEALAIDANNNIYLTGYFRDSIDLDPSSSNYYVKSKGNTDIFLAKYSPTGSFLWGFAIGGNNTDAGLDVEVNSKNQVIVTGFFSN